MTAPLPESVQGFAPPLGYDPRRDIGDEYWFDEDAANIAEGFFANCLEFTEGALARQPFDLSEPGREWERWLVRNLFGWKRTSDNLRRYRKVFIYIPRKNGKTTFTAALLTAFMWLDDEPAPQYFSVAMDKKQGSLVYQHVKRMIEAKPILEKACKIKASQGIICKGDLVYEVLAGDYKGKHGLNPQLYTVDELHEQQDSEYISVLETAMGAREQPVQLYLTTADYDRPSPCNEMLKYAEKVAQGEIKDHLFLPMIFQAVADPNDADWWTREETWKAANPGYGHSLRPDWMRSMCREAKGSPRKENDFKRLLLNYRTKPLSTWLKLSAWDNCHTYDISRLTRSSRCFGGLDLANTTDIAAFVLLFPDNGNLLLPTFWIPEDCIDESPNRVLYRKWVDSGDLDTTPGNVIDYAYIRQCINDAAGQYNLIDVGFDPYNATQLAIELAEEDGIETIKVPQGFSHMNEPSRRFEDLVIQGTIAHNDNPVMRWMAANVHIKTNSQDHIMPAKPSTGRGKRKRSDMGNHKVDGIIAAVMALSRAMFSDEEGESVYENRGVFTV